MTKLDGAERKLAGVDRGMRASRAVECCEGNDLWSVWRRSCRAFHALEQALEDERERLLQGRSKIFPVDVTPNCQVGRSPRDVMRVICAC